MCGAITSAVTAQNSTCNGMEFLVPHIQMHTHTKYPLAVTKCMVMLMHLAEPAGCQCTMQVPG